MSQSKLDLHVGEGTCQRVSPFIFKVDPSGASYDEHHTITMSIMVSVDHTEVVTYLRDAVLIIEESFGDCSYMYMCVSEL